MMKVLVIALSALLREIVLHAAASPHTFSVHDDLLALPQYEVNFSDEYVTELQVQLQLDEQKSRYGHGVASESRTYDGTEGGRMETARPGEVEYTRMRLDGQSYFCSIPQVNVLEERERVVNETESQQESELELARAADRGWELLSGMEGTCVYFISGWWSYRFCYNHGLRQFHQLPPSKNVPGYPPVEDPNVEGFTLGMYRQDSTNDRSSRDVSVSSGELVTRGESRYLVQRIEGGTKCDLTGKERRTEVQFHCNPQSVDRISLIKETSTCAYLVVIQTPRLCNDVAFRPPQKDEPHAIVCSPILEENEIARYESDVKKLRQAEEEAKIWEANLDAAQVFLGDYYKESSVIGDIAVGGHNLVPKEVKLEKSAILGGGKAVYVDTVASSTGKSLNREALEKLGMGDAKTMQEMEKLKAQLEQFAAGAEWKLEIVDTPHGRDLRGIVGKEEDEGKESGQSNEKKNKKSRKNKGLRADDDDDEHEAGSEEQYYREEL